MNLFVSLMRTLVPIVAGLVLGLAARVGLDLDDETVTLAVGAGLTAAYYAAFRALEELADRMAWEPLRLVAGVMLGWARPPQYPGDYSVAIRGYRHPIPGISDKEFMANLRRIMDRP